MAEYKTGIVAQVGEYIVQQTQTEPGVGGVLAAELIYFGAIRIYGVVIDNSLNTDISYLRCWDRTGAPTIGTDVPHMILKSDAGTKVQYNFDRGVYFGSGIMSAVVTTAGTAGATAPAGTMSVSYLLGA